MAGHEEALYTEPINSGNLQPVTEDSRKFCLNRKPHSPSLSLVSKNSLLLLKTKTKTKTSSNLHSRGRSLPKRIEGREAFSTSRSFWEGGVRERAIKEERSSLAFCSFVCLFVYKGWEQPCTDVSLSQVRKKWQPTPVILPGEFHEQKSLAGYKSMGLQRVRHDWATLYTHHLNLHNNP